MPAAPVTVDAPKPPRLTRDLDRGTFVQVGEEFAVVATDGDSDRRGLAVCRGDACDAAEPDALVTDDPAVRDPDADLDSGSLAHASVAYRGSSTAANRLSGTGAG